MSPEVIIAVIGGLIVLITLVVLILKKLPKKIKSVYYTKKWREIQKLCSNKDDWNHAIVHADMLLDEVLIKKRFSGKTMGERMVSAQKSFTSNDEIWSAHKLANTIRQDRVKKLNESDVKSALVSFRQALKDVKALR